MKLNTILCTILASISAIAYAKNHSYQLIEVVTLSRHSVRAPLSSPSSELGQVTNFDWIKWSAPKSELTLRGGILETEMGQYFRKWLDHEGLFKEAYCPNRDEINIYANSMQRTIATANYFAAAFKPVCGLKIYHRFKPNTMDPVFFPRLTKVTPAFTKLAHQQINQLAGYQHVDELTKSLEPSFNTLEKILDLTNSPICKKRKICQLNDFHTNIILKNNDEPRLTGTLQLGTKIADALILQYLEDPNDETAIFGKKLTFTQIQNISKIKDTYGDILFSTPIIAVNVANPLLIYMRDELLAQNRKFTYLVGHDSNLTSVMSALEIIPPKLTQAIETRTPIGSKLLFEKYVDKKSGEMFLKLQIMYQSTPQIRHLIPLDLNHPPIIEDLTFKGLTKNAAGLYKFKDVIMRFNQAITKYETIQ